MVGDPEKARAKLAFSFIRRPNQLGRIEVLPFIQALPLRPRPLRDALTALHREDATGVAAFNQIVRHPKLDQLRRFKWRYVDGYVLPVPKRTEGHLSPHGADGRKKMWRKHGAPTARVRRRRSQDKIKGPFPG